MENQIEQFNFLKLYELFKPELTELHWPKSVDINIHEFEASISFKECTGVGRGSSGTSPDQALEIACTEALERLLVKLNNIDTTNGVAGHVTREKAENSALRELIERHVFLAQFYRGHFAGTQLDVFYEEAFRKSASNFGQLRYFSYVIGEVKSGERIYFVAMNICKVKIVDRIDGYIVGLGCNENLDRATEAAELENLRYLAYLNSAKDTKGLSLGEFLVRREPSFEDHGFLALDSQYSQKIEQIIDVRLSDPLKASINDIEFEQLKIPEEIGFTGLYFSKASSNSCLDLMTGLPDDKFIKKFRTLFGIELSEDQEKYFSNPHPLA